MSTLVSVVVSGPARPQSRDLAAVLEVELGVHPRRATSMASAITSGTPVVVFQGARGSSSLLHRRLESVGLEVACEDRGIVEEVPDVICRPIPRRRSRS